MAPHMLGSFGLGPAGESAAVNIPDLGWPTCSPGTSGTLSPSPLLGCGALRGLKLVGLEFLESSVFADCQGFMGL